MHFSQRKHVFFVAIVFSICLLPAFAQGGLLPAQPDKALFYPDEVQLSVTVEANAVSLPSGGKGFVVVLPQGVLRDTFMLSLGGAPAQGYYWPEKEEKEAILASQGKPAPAFANLPDNETDAARRALLEKLFPLDTEAARIAGEVHSVQMRRDLLRKSYENYGQNAGEKVSPAEEAAKLSALYGDAYARLEKELLLQQKSLADASQALARAQKELENFDRLHNGDVVVIPHDEGGRQKLEYAYVLPASCEQSYRLDARPDKKEFSLNQDAAFRQDSGFSWKDVDLYLSTVRRDKTLRPANLRPWEIRLVSRPKAADYKMSQASSVMREEQAMMAPAPAPSEDSLMVKQEARPRINTVEDRGTYRVWSLGKRDIAHGMPVNLSLASNVYPAKFMYTLRPIHSPKGFLTADVDLPEAIELPQGMAQFSVDGAVMGRQFFSFDGNKGTIFFGSDPQVTAIMRDLKRTSGEQGFFSKEQTRSWHWEITLKSTRPNPVVAILEDPAPVSKDEAVNLIVQSTPRPEELVNEPIYGGARIYRWEVTLNPGEPVLVNHQIQLVVPMTPDKEISPGR